MPISPAALEKLAAHHGLSIENDDDSGVDEAIENSYSQSDVDDLENRAQAGDKARSSLADQAVKMYANRIGTAPASMKHWRDQLCMDYDGAVAVLEAMPAARLPLHNRATAGVPETNGATGLKPTEEKAAKKRASAIKNRADAIVSANPKISYQNAWKQAEREVPAS
jgi:hypothetical protein